MEVRPSRKQIASNMFDFPEPLGPVIALNYGSSSATTVFLAYDLNPSKMILFILI